MRDGDGASQADKPAEPADSVEPVGALPGAVFVSDQRGRVTYLNLAALAFGPSMLEAPSEIAEDIEPPPMLGINPRERTFGGEVDLRVDVSEFRRVQRVLAHIAQDQAVLYRFTDRLYRAQSLHDVYEAALEAICAGLRCKRASILLFDQDAVMRFVAWRGLSSGYRTAVSGHTPWRPGETDPQPIWVHDILENDEPQPIKEAVIGEGIRAAAFIPLIAGGGVVGKFMAYHAEPHVFSEAEAEFAVTIARQLGFSLEQRLAAQRLTESEGQLRSMFEHAGVGMALMTADGKITAANSALCSIVDRPLKDMVRLYCSELTHPDDRAANEHALRRLSTDGGSVALEKRIIRPDGACLWVRITLSHVGDGQVLAVVEDVNARKRAEAALLETQAELTAAMEAGQLALFDMDHVTGVMRPSARLNALYGYAPDHPMTLEDIRARYHPDQGAQFIAEAHDHQLNPDLRQFHYLIRLALPEGATRWVEGRGEYLRDAAGAVVRSRGVLQDVTERKRWEEHQRLLVNELNHRVKNSLAIVQGLAQQSFRSGEASDAGRRVFEARLAALSAAHDLLTRGGWESALLQEVVETSLDAALGPAAARVDRAGPPVRLSPQTSVSVALAIHELSTNALKYGALSNDSGRIDLDWRLEGEGEACRLKIVWTESGGPAVQAPKSRGFGSRMIERGLAAELGGVARLDFRTEGLVCAIDAPAPCGD